MFDDKTCICDTCAGDGLPCYTRLYLLNPDDPPEKLCARYNRRRESNWEKLFGTPERAARTLANFCGECDGDCAGCKFGEFMEFNVYEPELLEWLEAEAGE